jgi:hypothetical protein
MRGVRIVAGLAVLVFAIGVVPGAASAKKPVLVLRKEAGGPILTPHQRIDGYGYELEGADDNCNPELGEEAAELTTNQKPKDKIALHFALFCNEVLGPGHLAGRLTGIQLTSTGEVIVKGKVSAAVDCTGKCAEEEGQPGGICHYETKKLTGVLPLPEYLGLRASGAGALNPKISAASCAPSEQIGMFFELYLPKTEGTLTRPFYRIYAERSS